DTGNLLSDLARRDRLEGAKRHSFVHQRGPCPHIRNNLTRMTEHQFLTHRPGKDRPPVGRTGGDKVPAGTTIIAGRQSQGHTGRVDHAARYYAFLLRPPYRSSIQREPGPVDAEVLGDARCRPYDDRVPITPVRTP